MFLFEPHTKPINVLSFDPFNSSRILSCSYDGTVRCGDMEKQQFTQVCDVTSTLYAKNIAIEIWCFEALLCI